MFESKLVAAQILLYREECAGATVCGEAFLAAIISPWLLWATSAGGGLLVHLDAVACPAVTGLYSDFIWPNTRPGGTNTGYPV
jgi:hypothetical protein